MGFFSPVIEWQSLPERGFLLDHTLPHRLPLQTAKGEKDTDVQKTHTEAAHVNKVTVRYIEHLSPAKTYHKLVYIIQFPVVPLTHPQFSPPPFTFLFSSSVYRLHLPQESTTQISTATAAFVLTFCDHSGLQLSPSPKVGWFSPAFRLLSTFVVTDTWQMLLPV